MNQTMDKGKEPAPERVMVLQNLPHAVMRTLTKEEIQAFLFEEEWPDSLKEKLAGYLE